MQIASSVRKKKQNRRGSAPAPPALTNNQAGVINLFICHYFFERKWKMNIRTCITLAILTTITGTALAGDYDISAESNTRYGTLSQGRVDEGVVVNVRMVRIEPSTMAKTVGTGVGAALGAAAGNQLNKDGGNYAATALVGVIGGLAGNVATDALAQDSGQELIIRKSGGQLVVITQAGSSLAVGQAIYLVDSAGKTRVIPQ